MNNIEMIKNLAARNKVINSADVLYLIAQLEAAQKERDELKELNCHFDLSIRKTEGISEVLRSKLEAAERTLIRPLPIGELVHRLEGQTYEKWFSESDVKDLRERAQKAEAALSAANEKLSKPIAVPRRIESIVFRQPLEVEDMWRHRFIAAIKAAGFKVEGEPAPVKYIVILQRAWCNDSGSGINYHSDLIEFDKRDKAIKYGFKLQDSDDFNIGVLTNGVLTSFDWMAKPIAETKDSLARIANGIGIEGNADAE
ncbi:hypothetical protein [Yersinia aleksiciae]|uniref:hypothetical protein n=1 Tax=Yersinia aleksiciae TaxID=263819 RepID=UPI0021BD2ED9|nr:hypothetical protein [Yersinia aleksiciae]